MVFKIFYAYIHKIKNPHNFKLDNLSRSLFLTPEVSILQDHDLFKSIVLI